MRPHDIVVLLKILTFNHNNWLGKDIAADLMISPSEISESLRRSHFAGLINMERKSVHKAAIYDFLIYGLPFVFPVRPGAIVRGVPTAHSAPPLSSLISSHEHYVWPYEHGDIRGQSIEPLYSKIPQVALKDPDLYALLALSDALRVGLTREKEIARLEMKKYLLNNEYETSH